MQEGSRSGLEVGSSHDPLEAEATRIANEVIGTSSLVRMSAPPTRSANTVELAAKPGIGESGRSLDQGTASDLRQLPAQPMSPQLRGFFEPRFGCAFDNVRVSTGSQTNLMAERLGARAFSFDNMIGFGRGELAPHTISGQHLMAHELAHVVQSGQASATPGPNSVPNQHQHKSTSLRLFAATQAGSSVVRREMLLAHGTADLTREVIDEYGATVGRTDTLQDEIVSGFRNYLGITVEESTKSNGDVALVLNENDADKKSAKDKFLTAFSGGALTVPQGIAIHDADGKHFIFMHTPVHEDYARVVFETAQNIVHDALSGSMEISDRTSEPAGAIADGEGNIQINKDYHESYRVFDKVASSYDGFWITMHELFHEYGEPYVNVLADARFMSLKTEDLRLRGLEGEDWDQVEEGVYEEGEGGEEEFGNEEFEDDEDDLYEDRETGQNLDSRMRGLNWKKLGDLEERTSTLNSAPNATSDVANQKTSTNPLGEKAETNATYEYFNPYTQKVKIQKMPNPGPVVGFVNVLRAGFGRPLRMDYDSTINFLVNNDTLGVQERVRGVIREPGKGWSDEAAKRKKFARNRKDEGLSSIGRSIENKMTTPTVEIELPSEKLAIFSGDDAKGTSNWFHAKLSHESDPTRKLWIEGGWSRVTDTDNEHGQLPEVKFGGLRLMVHDTSGRLEGEGSWSTEQPFERAQVEGYGAALRAHGVLEGVWVDSTGIKRFWRLRLSPSTWVLGSNRRWQELDTNGP